MMILIYNFFFSTYTVIYYIKFVIFFTVIWIILLFWYIFFKEIVSNFISQFEVLKCDRFYNLVTEEYIDLPVIYKITSFKITIFKIICYFSLTFCLVSSLRYFRLGTDIIISNIILKSSFIPFLIKINLFLLFSLYIYLFKNFWYILTLYLFHELKKIHIFLHFYDEKLNDVNQFNKPYQNSLQRVLLNIISFKYYLYHLYEKPSHLNHYSYPDLKKHLNLSGILARIYYFLIISKYKHSFFVKIIKNIIEEINKSFWTILKIIPILIILIIFVYEIKIGIIRYTFYVTFFMFFYKILIDLIYFFYHTNNSNTIHICLCYYKYYDLFIDNKYGKSLRIFFNIRTDHEQDALITAYIISNLNWLQALARVKNQEWPIIESFTGLKIKYFFEYLKQKELYILISNKLNKIKGFA